MANLVVLYGPQKVGKTTYLLRLIEYYQSLGLEVRGIVSPAVFHEDIKVGIDVRDIYSGQQRNLAAKRPFQVSQMAGNLSYVFDDESVKWGKQVLKSSLPTEVFIVDEIGPLELKKNQGWKEAIGQIMLQQYKLGIVVLRESLHEMVADKWPVTEWIEYHKGLRVNAFDHYFHR